MVKKDNFYTEIEKHLCLGDDSEEEVDIKRELMEFGFPVRIGI